MSELFGAPERVDITAYPMRTIRRALGMTIGELARSSGLRTSTVSELERRKRRPNYKEWQKLERAITHRMAHVIGYLYADVSELPTPTRDER